MTRRRFLVPLLLGAFPFLVPFDAEAEVRDWTNSQGKKIQAELVEIAGDKAVLKMNGRNFEVPLASLSSADREFIENWKKSAPTDAASDAGVDLNWDGPWPKVVSVDVGQSIEVLKEDKSAREYVYASDHYEFICDVKLNTSVVTKFSRLFEATNLFVRELPLGMAKPFRAERHKIHLFEQQETYYSKGGVRGTAGVYISRGGEGDILLPLTSLGVKKVGSNFSVDYDKENSALSHEITHQITDYDYYAPGSRGWFTEGLAEYISQSGYRSGKFNVDDLTKLKAYVTGYGEDGKGGRVLGEELNAPDLQEFMSQDYGSFLKNAGFSYGFSALLVYYYFHMDGEGDAANIKNFLKGLKQGKKIPEIYEPLLAGRDWDAMEEDVTKSWRGRGIRIRFN